MEEAEYEYQEAGLEFECEVCNTVADWENWETADYCGFVLPQENGEQRMFIQDIIFICPNCKTEVIVSWYAILSCIEQNRLSPN